ncbi:hypothetical protein EYR36_007832 [Pleurotus pulmonarius]|nr:hypothetical protein EYR36_007832 [Pleurotus pulmonarius]
MTATIPWPFYYSTPSTAAAEPVVNKESTAASLHHYSTPGVSPPSARVDPKLKPLQRKPIRLWDVWKYGLVAVSKVTEVTMDVVSHGIWGPRRKSWGIEMTILSSIMRGAGQHSSLIDLRTLRMLMSIGGLVPLPSDALVTPVTFRVRKRRLRGILSEIDSKEDGSRELSGEWVVGRRTWLRLQAEWKASHQKLGSKDKSHKVKKERVILYIHGGAYYLSSAAAMRLISIPLSKYTDARVFSLDYRLAPESRFPGPLHDAVTGYLRLVEDLHIPPENIVIAGDSAGGGLTLALLMYLRDNAYPLPAGAILMSPWVDLTMSCESWESNSRYDVIPIPNPGDHLDPVSAYLGEHMERFLTHPYASPLFGDFKGLPPLLIQSGDAEVLRDEITLLAHKATLAGVNVRHELYEDAIHVFQLYPFLDASRRAFMSAREFVRKTLPDIQSRSPQMLDNKAEDVLEQEIDNENATVVRGDGVETVSGMEEVKQELEREEEIEDSSMVESSDSEDEGRGPKEYPSWGKSQIWSSLSSTPSSIDDLELEDAEEDLLSRSERRENTNAIGTTSSQVPPRRTLRRRATMPTLTTLKRLSSAISYIMPDPMVASPPKLVHHTHTTLTSPSASTSAKPPLSRTHTSDSLHRHGSRSRASNLSLSMVSPPPSPSIRRFNSSHPDITSLVEQWTSSGPANRTMMYKPLNHSSSSS